MSIHTGTSFIQTFTFQAEKFAFFTTFVRRTTTFAFSIFLFSRNVSFTRTSSAFVFDEVDLHLFHEQYQSMMKNSIDICQGMWDPHSSVSSIQCCSRIMYTSSVDTDPMCVCRQNAGPIHQNSQISLVEFRESRKRQELSQVSV